ncbi:MAG: cobyric acid synthase [Deltaproteobacteria bacterium]|nr:cobyric acid synthase [Deltaproteobacteria bacterium]
MSAARLLVVGTASNAGKSVLVTGLCRLYARRGFRVAPFKAQNMALNSFVTPEGGEIGRSQAVQAEACGLTPSVLLNPVLLKPNSDHTSQVIVLGKAVATMDAKAYYAFRHTLKPRVLEAFNTLAAESDLVIMEGAGSPAEINLRENDLVNMGMAAMADAPAVLVGDIDRGGVFASLYGTVKLLEPDERARIKGIVINRFRGDLAILEPGLRRIEVLLGIPVLGVLPYWDIRVEEEDSLAERLTGARAAGPGDVDIAVIRLPRIANFTDFGIFDLLHGVSLRYVKPGESLGSPDLCIIPGSKSTIADMRVLDETGMAGAIRRYHASGGVVAGVCGGYQMLGREVADPSGAESDIPLAGGLGLLDVTTVFSPEKQTVQAEGRVLPVPGPLAGATGSRVEGYEIHMGRTVTGAGTRPLLELRRGGTEGAVSPDGRVFGTYLHGIFDSFPFVRSLVNHLRERKGLQPLEQETAAHETYREYRMAQYDRLADMLERHLDLRALETIIALDAKK